MSCVFLGFKPVDNGENEDKRKADMGLHIEKKSGQM